MKRSPLWWAAFALAHRQNRIHAVHIEKSGLVERVPSPPADIGRMCAVEADACEAAYVAAFGSVPT